MQLSSNEYRNHLALPQNLAGRDFCVGDLHGQFAWLEKAMENLAFDPARDRLLSVGDLIDRGPESHRALEFLAQPWFFSVRGNHEAIFLENSNLRGADLAWLVQAGAEWWLSLDEKAREELYQAFAMLPFTMGVDTQNGRIGVVHADIPADYDWDGFVADLPKNKYLQEYALWSRHRINQFQNGQFPPPVDGLKLLVVGHTPVETVSCVANVCFLDTGAAYAPEYPTAALSLLQIHPFQKLYSFPPL